MSEDPVFEFETDLDAEELLIKAEQAARDKGYDVKEKENSITFNDSKYKLRIDDGEVELYGDNSGALGAYKARLQGKL